MGKIFGISDLPVSTIMSPFEQQMNFRPPFSDELDYVRQNKSSKFDNSADSFVSKNPRAKSNPVISMRNGFGKLMKYFSKKV